MHLYASLYTKQEIIYDTSNKFPMGLKRVTQVAG